MTTPSESQRNARLDALLANTKAWADQQRAQLENRLASNKRILLGRTGSERLAQASVQAASDLLVSEIDDFLVTRE